MNISKVKTSLLLAILLLIFPALSYSQVVTFEPSFATQLDTLTLTFDATQGNGELQGFTGDVYLYTGLITDQSTDDTDWKYVKPTGGSSETGWDVYPNEVKMTSKGNDIWEFEYPSSIREFYGVAQGEEVEKITLLFRGTNDGAGNPDKVGRGTGGTDILLTLFKNEVSAQFLNPIGNSTQVRTTETVEIVGLGNSPAGNLNLTLKLDGVEAAQTSSSDTVRYSFSSLTEGNFRFDLLADDGVSQSDSVSFNVIVSDGATLEARPEGLEDGITYGENGTSVTLSLFAPGKNDVYVIGDFSDWELDFEFQMKKDSVDANNVWFWTEITGLTPGEEYGFQYEIDGEIRIADPYSALVLHPNDDKFIPETVYPNLKEYPTGKTTNYVGVLTPGKTPYAWEATDYQRPAEEDLIIYELLIRDFVADHSYQSLIDTLDYIEGLGINAIELMPVNEFDGNESWGYSPNFHLALDKYYGSPDKFKEFIDEAHKRGIAVILDVVMNHGTGQNALYRMYEHGSNPYFNTTATHSFNVFNDFNHQYPGTQYYTKKMIEHWIQEYKVDGFRWDLTKGFTQNCTNDDACTSNYQQDRVDLLKKYADYQWAVDPNFYVIFEHLGTSGEEKQWADYRLNEGKGIMLWGKMSDPYNQSSMGYSEGSNLYGVLSESRGFEGDRLIGYMESHDEQWLMFKNISFGNSSGDYNIKELDTALNRQKLVGSFFFTLPGPKMIWQFGELGYGYGDNGEQCLKPGDGDGNCAATVVGRVDKKPIRWDYWNTKGTQRIALYETWSALINLRKNSSAFTDPDMITYSLDGKVKWIKIRDNDTDVTVMGNFDVVEQNLDLAFVSTGTWYRYFEDSQIEVNDGNTSFTLAPGEFRIYTTKQFETPDLSVSNEPVNPNMPSSFKLHNNYPNPFNPSTQIKFDVAKAGNVKVEVYDILGRKVATLIDGRRAVGTYEATFDASSLSSGVYFTRFTAGNKVQVQKMTLLK